MKTQIICNSGTNLDILYIGQQINLDLQALSSIYSGLLPLPRAFLLFNSSTTLLLNYAVSSIGFTIYDPTDSDLIYIEYHYKINYGGDIFPIRNTDKHTEQEDLPASAVFIPWVVWSDHLLNLSQTEQEPILQGTGWTILGKDRTFQGRYAIETKIVHCNCWRDQQPRHVGSS